jgi:hypothetical protein
MMRPSDSARPGIAHTGMPASFDPLAEAALRPGSSSPARRGQASFAQTAHPDKNQAFGKGRISVRGATLAGTPALQISLPGRRAPVPSGS